MQNRIYFTSLKCQLIIYALNSEAANQSLFKSIITLDPTISKAIQPAIALANNSFFNLSIGNSNVFIIIKRIQSILKIMDYKLSYLKFQFSFSLNHFIMSNKFRNLIYIYIMN